ncbi:MAG TPA: TetR/AcrR family transcriptional regulator [Xanthobacteraceae bacterium]|jgi:AcrR family transcriptional regulator
MAGASVARRRGKAGSGSGRTPTRRPPRVQDPQERRAAILDAALAEFAARGFADTRLDDVAARAGIAKGTIYLYFRDKETLFQELVRAKLSPLVGSIAAAAARELSTRALAELIVDTFLKEIFGTPRQDVIRLIITEGSRFPELAELYYREVISRVLPIVRARLRQAAKEGEATRAALARFPQLLVAPALIAIVWSSLFGRFEPLDVHALMRAHLAILFGSES